MPMNPMAGGAQQPMPAAEAGQRRAYPSAADMPEVQSAQRIEEGQGLEGGANPVTDSLKTLVQFVLALKEKGVPMADSLQQHLSAFIGELTQAGQGGAGAGAPAGTEAQQPGAQPPAEGAMPAPEEGMAGEPAAMPAEGAPPPEEGSMGIDQSKMPPKKRRTSPITSISPMV